MKLSITTPTLPRQCSTPPTGPLRRSALGLALLLVSAAASAHTVWLEDDPHGTAQVVRFGGHAGVLESYPAEKLQQVQAFDAEGRELSVVREGRDDGVRLWPQGEAALMALSFDNGYWSRLGNGRSENLAMNQVSGAVSSTHALKYHKRILQWGDSVTQPLGQPFELLPLSNTAPLAGQPLRLRVQIDGQPAGGIALAFGEEGEVTRSDRQGNASLVVRPGLNRIWAGQRQAVSGDPRLTERSIEYSLVFEAEQ